MGERERESELSEFIFSYWIFFGERNRMDLGFRGIYDHHHQCIPKKNWKRERERRADLVESWEFRDWEMWKLFDDASAGFVEGKRFDSLSFFCFFLLLFSFFFSLFWFGYLNKLYVDTEFERERESWLQTHRSGPPTNLKSWELRG